MKTLPNIALKLKLISMIALGSAGLLFMPAANALDIKQEQINSCVNGTVSYQIADKETATKLCTCTVNVRSNMTIGQLWEIESYARSGKDPAQLPYVKQMQQQLQQCTNGLTLNPPKKPKA